MQKKLLIVVESYVRWMFFSRMGQSIENMGYQLLYVTTCPSVFLQGKKAGVAIQLVDINKRAYDGIIPENIYLETLDVKSGELSGRGAEGLARVIYANLWEMEKTYRPDYLFIYNGTTVFGAVTGYFARERGIKTLYFELANLPGKMFVDPDGTGGFSRLYKEPSIIDSYHYDLNEFSNWCRGFTEWKLTNGFVPQVAHGKDSFHAYFFYTVDKLYFSSLVGERGHYVRCYIEKFANAFLRKNKMKYDELVGISDKPYLFYPMQVSHDSQILLHSQMNNSEAIIIANDLARESGVTLIVKPHPAEVDKSNIGKIYKLKEKLGFTLSCANTMKLVQNAKAVVTINSTVGLEAKIAGKRVHTLGKAIYKNFDDTALAKYVQNYLVSMDYFSDKVIDEPTVKMILSRARAC